MNLTNHIIWYSQFIGFPHGAATGRHSVGNIVNVWSGRMACKIPIETVGLNILGNPEFRPCLLIIFLIDTEIASTGLSAQGSVRIFSNIFP